MILNLKLQAFFKEITNKLKIKIFEIILINIFYLKFKIYNNFYNYIHALKFIQY